MNTPPLLEVTDLVKRFDTAPGQPPLAVLEGVNLALAPGETVAIVGPSGSGKSTLLHAICGLVPITSGHVRFDGRDLSTLDANQLAEWRNREIGLVFQDHHLLPQCTVLENVLLPTIAGWPGPEGGDPRARAQELCERVGLRDRLTHRPGQLSGGERQRVAVVRALIMRPKLLLADEPTGSLDERTSAELTELLAELNRELGVALLTVTHSERLARRMSSCLELRDGKLQARESVA